MCSKSETLVMSVPIAQVEKCSPRHSSKVLFSHSSSGVTALLLKTNTTLLPWYETAAHRMGLNVFQIPVAFLSS